MATGFVDLASLPFTMTGLLEPEQAVGSTAYLTSKGLLPPPQEGVIPETIEMVSGAMSPGGAGKELLSGLLGITAYHGSPYLFKQLDPARIGSGEGAQAYGSGAGYTSAGRPVAESYRASVAAQKNIAGQNFDNPTIQGKQINWDSPEEIAAFELARHAGDRKAAADFHARSFLGGEDNPAVKLLRSDKELPQVDMPGYLYKGDISDEIIPSFLNWDQPIKSQDAFSKIKDHPEIVAYAQKTGKDIGKIKGRDAYELIASGFDVGQQEAYPLATQYLDSLGVRGIRYLDQGSRSNNELTSNFVVFRPEDYQIQEINDIPLEEYIRKGLLD
jgi:hypothetical protein